MIDRITITCNEFGFWEVNAGDVIHTQTGSIYELLLTLKDLSTKLGYFPRLEDPIQHEPVSINDLPWRVMERRTRETKKVEAARKRAERHLAALQKPAQQKGPYPDAGSEAG